MLKLGVCGISAAIFWLMTFQAGLLVSSKPFRDEIGRGHLTVHNFSWTLLSYTITNIAFLCWIAGIVGAVGRLAISPPRPIRKPEKQGLGQHQLTEICSTAVLRGFLIYLLFLAGVFISTSNPFEYTQEQYARMAGTISILSFLVNYESSFFSHLMGRIRSQHEAQTVTAWAPNDSLQPLATETRPNTHNGLVPQRARPKPMTLNKTGDETK
jgi:hypothetical protein